MKVSNFEEVVYAVFAASYQAIAEAKAYIGDNPSYQERDRFEGFCRVVESAVETAAGFRQQEILLGEHNGELIVGREQVQLMPDTYSFNYRDPNSPKLSGPRFHETSEVLQVFAIAEDGTERFLGQIYQEWLDTGGSIDHPIPNFREAAVVWSGYLKYGERRECEKPINFPLPTIRPKVGVKVGCNKLIEAPGNMTVFVGHHVFDYEPELWRLDLEGGRMIRVSEGQIPENTMLDGFEIAHYR